MIDNNLNYAIIGVSADPVKYGHLVFNDLLTGGYRVFGVNPKVEKVLGQKIYRTLSAVPKRIDVVIFVVPPAVTEKILPEVKKLGIKKVWLQPGSENPAAIDYCEKNGIDCTHDACVMIERKN